MTYTPRQIADALDLAVLKPNATRNDVECACALAYKHKIKSVCVAPIYVPLAVNLFGNVSCVIGFPHGNSTRTPSIVKLLTHYGMALRSWMLSPIMVGSSTEIAAPSSKSWR